MKKQKRQRLTLLRAMHLMRRPGARMVRTNITATGKCEYWITPDVYVDAALAAQIKRHPQVRAGKDSLFPGMDQTWCWSA